MKQLKRLYYKSLQNNFVKDVRIAYLEELLKKHGILEPQPQCIELLTFSKFSNYFEAKELTILRSLDFCKKTDTTFIRHCLQFLYKDNMAVFRTKSALGAPKRIVNSTKGNIVDVPTTEPISPEKYVILKGILSDGNLSEFEREEREKTLNRLLGKAISSIRVNLSKSDNTVSLK